MSFHFRDRLAGLVREAAAAGVMVGTSSWKYAGWCGQIYDEQRYLTRGRFSEAKFERECLREYAETFSTVCVDAGYYQFPSERWVEKLCGQVPETFRFSFKVTDAITIRRYSQQVRHGSLAGKMNPHFLNAELFCGSFLRPLTAMREQVGVLIFEFSQFYPSDFERGRDFVQMLDAFLGALPGGWQFAVEMRTRSLLVPEYFAMLARHGVAHVYNAWARMPGVGEQLAMAESQTADFTAARLLLTAGRSYAEAVERFSPYREVQARDDGVRADGKALLERAKKGKRPSFIYVNNRLEGNAPETIAVILES